jgi:hypothetical protein
MKILVFGASGSAGGAVLAACLSTPLVQEVRAIARRSAARTLQTRSPRSAFHYISGQGTSPGSRMFWSGVKPQTELELIDLVGADCWRPAFIDASPSPSLPKIYSVVFPAMRLLKPFRRLYVAGDDLGYAMLQATTEKLRARIIENPEIRDLAARFRS